MNFLSNLFKRKEGKYSRRQNKKGASLAFVMMIGAALVIWVMCIMPLMTTTGTIVYQNEAELTDYLDSRSVIEFCKSELEKIVEDRIPYTFAVTGSVESKFAAVPKLNTTDLTLSTAYSTKISSPDVLDDRKDFPTSNEVRAICAVEPNANSDAFDIQITTWHDCEKGITYTATFTPRGSLRIFPEAYGEKQALPLSDFVLVDGKLGKYEIWTSNIKNLNWSSDSFSINSITETLKPWILEDSEEWTDQYANAGRYPAIFKSTANAASSEEGDFIGSVMTDGVMTTEKWVMPEAVSKDSPVKLPGNIWFDGKKIYIQGKEAATELTGATIYYNGTASSSAPTKAGTYQITIDYPGSGAYVEGALNILPAQGLTLPDYKTVNATDGAKNTVTETVKIESSVVETERDYRGNVISTTIKVTLTSIRNQNGLLYGCLSSDEGATVKWQTTNVFSKLETGKNYYFYICRPATIDSNGVYHPASDVVKVGSVISKETLTYADTLVPGESYLLLNSDGSKILTPSLGLTSEFPSPSSSLSTLTWTVGGSGSNLTFSNGSAYLDITGEADYSLSIARSTTRHQHGRYSTGRCYKATFTSNGFDNIKVQTSNDGVFTVTSNNGNFTLKKNLTETVSYREYYTDRYGRNACSYSEEKEGTVSATLYLNLGRTLTASTSSSTVKFMKVPSNPDVNPASITYSLNNYEMTYGANTMNFVTENLNPNHTLEKVYANSTAVNGNLNAGVYGLGVTTNLGTAGKRASVILDSLTVKKADQLGALTFSTEKNIEDELAVTVTCNNWHQNSGTRYFGYRKLNDTEDSLMHWFLASDNSFTFRLEYGEYIFAVRESGTTNYNGMTVEAAEATVIEPNWVDLTADMKNQFMFTFDASTGEAIWYDLPDRIFPRRVQLVFGIPVGTNDIRWVQNYTSEVRFYGVVIPNTPFADMDHVLQIPQPVGITTVNGHQSSMMRGQSLYFMGNNASINTYGNSIYLTTDLLVLRNTITGDGKVFVAPYTPNDGTNYTLLFNPKSTSITLGTASLAPYTFYKIEANKDLNSLTDAYLAAEGRTLGEPTDNAVKYLFRQGAFPEVNLDIAYADDKQLRAIVSSETVGWTNNGKLGSTNASKTYPKFAVCSYISEITSSANNKDYTANRILITAVTDDGINALIVPSSVSFTVRYLSLDANQIIQKGSPYFRIYNLGEDADFIKSILNALGLNGFSSKSLQVDYEQFTSIILNSGATTNIQKQIYRYDNGTNIFSNPTPEELTVLYTTSEIENLFGQGSLLGFVSGNGVKVIDRYISLSSTNGNSFDVSSLVGSDKLSLYVNYIHFDDSIKEIKFTSLFGGSSSDIVISSQESGYNDTEYLVYFHNNSAEKYKGTLLYFEDDLEVSFKSLFSWNDREFTIEKGFYYVYATTNGTSISALEDLFTGEDLSQNTKKKPYKVDPESLAEYSIYVNPDGTLSNSYVDTGLEDNNSTAVGGFSGGNMG